MQKTIKYTLIYYNPLMYRTTQIWGIKYLNTAKQSLKMSCKSEQKFKNTLN